MDSVSYLYIHVRFSLTEFFSTVLFHSWNVCWCNGESRIIKKREEESIMIWCAASNSTRSQLQEVPFNPAFNKRRPNVFFHLPPIYPAHPFKLTRWHHQMTSRLSKFWTIKKKQKKTQTRTQSFEHFEGKEPNDRGSAGTEEGADLTTNHCICAENSQNSLNESMAQEAHYISAAMTLVAL